MSLPEMFQFMEESIFLFILILTRVGGVLASAPMFGSLNVPPTLKIGLAALVALLLAPVVGPAPAVVGIWDGLLLIIMELIVGLMIGLVTYFVFVAAQLAGQIVDLQMGFGIVNVIDPVTSNQVSIMGQFKFLIVILVFLAVDGPHIVLRAASESYDVVPIGQGVLGSAGWEYFSSRFSQVFILAIRFAAPTIGALLLTNLALGVMARTVPQMNVFIVGLPVSIAVGLFSVAMASSFLALTVAGHYRSVVPSETLQFLRAMR